jgi:hypothetical protein
MNISQFKASLDRRGMLHNTDFEVRITPPPGLVSVGISPQELSLRASSADMPGRSIQTAASRNAIGPERQIGYNSSYIPITINFIAESRHFIKRFLESWQDLAIGNFRVNSSPNTSKFNLGYYNDYVGTIDIIQYDRELGTPVYTCKLLECYPVTINPIDLAWNGTNRTIEISASWLYRYYTDNDFSSPPSRTTSSSVTSNVLRDQQDVLRRGI